MSLERIGIYLAPRDMKIKIGEAYSERKELTFSVPQGSCSGTNFFNMYCSTISKVLDPNLGLIAFANDHAIVKEFNSNKQAEEIKIINLLTANLASNKSWMNSARLKMSNVKSEFIIFSNRIQVKKCISSELNIDGVTVGRLQVIRYLGAWLYSDLSLKTHVKKKCATAMINLQRIKNIRKY